MNEHDVRELSRRTFLGRGAAGLGVIALNALVGTRLSAAMQGATRQSKGAVNPLDVEPKAKRVIFLYQAGGPSHLETFDDKPKLAEMSGKPMPESLTRGQQIAQLQGQRLTCFGPTHGFRQFGDSGQMVCELFPHIGGIVDDTCIVRSMWTEQINHDPAHTFMNSGSIITGRPSMGSWVLYGLGAEADNLPGFVVLVLYGAKPGDGSFASNCLLARRLAERGVRFIQLYHRDWDHHSDVRNNVVFKAQEVDKATAALITDLKQRGMLDDTLVVWGGEFGRTPMSQGRGGRDHHIKGFSFMLAGGGIKKGLAYGATDDLGYAAVDHPVSVHDFHATMLYLLGIDAAKLAVKYQGLDVRLTGPEGGTVVRDIIA